MATESPGAALTTSAACLNALIGHGGGYVNQSLRVEAECDALHNRRRFASRAQHTAVRHRAISPVLMELGPRGRWPPPERGPSGALVGGADVANDAFS